MAQRTARIRLYQFPYSQQIFDSRIERIIDAPGGAHGPEVQINIRGLRALSRGEICVEQGQPWERFRAEAVPLRLRFHRATWASRTGVFADLDALPSDHSARRLFDIVHVRLPGQGTRYWLFTDYNSAGNELALHAAVCTLEERAEESRPVMVRRRWSWRPPSPGGLVPQPASLHSRYGGDPIAIHLGRRVYRRRLFIGGLHHQTEARPLVDHVLNLCSEANPWVAAFGAHPADRHARKGELAAAMTAEELLAEASWVAEHLRAGQRVLVHCAAGINRSSTVCCAALMLLEDLSPEEALTRVRERHPLATPDPYHWFWLRWLVRADVNGPEPASSPRVPRATSCEGRRR
jgi:hypothetical protein